MTSAITNKSSKTRDFEKWGMVDPIATYNEADDCCATAFSKFNSKIQLASSEDERQMNKANRRIPFSHSTFNDYRQAATMRQAGMQLAQNSQYNLQQALLGNEASNLR